MLKKSTCVSAFDGQDEIYAQAFILGQRLNMKAFLGYTVIKNLPLMIAVGDGVAVLFRYGVVVLFGLTDEQKESFLAEAQEHISLPHGNTETESLVIYRSKERADKVLFDGIYIAEWKVDRLLVIADILAKSQVLSYHEQQVAKSLEAIEPISLEMQTKGYPKGKRARQLLRSIATTLSTERNMAGQAEILDKPDFLWDATPDLQGFFVRLEDEYELRERHSTLKGKLDLVYRTSEMMLNLMNSRHTLHVEWYIVILIVIDIAIHIFETYIFN